MTAAEAQRELEAARARERDAAERVAQLQERLAEAERAAARVADLEHELGVRGDELDRARAEIAGLRDRCAAAEATVAHVRRVNDGLERSLSWRVTRPLRALKQALRG